MAITQGEEQKESKSMNDVKDVKDTKDTKDRKQKSPIPDSTLKKQIFDDKKHEETLKKIHTEMKENNTHLFNQRLLILKKIKDNPEIDKKMKDHICGSLLAIFKLPPNTDLKDYPILEPTGIPKFTPNTTIISTTQDKTDKISINELDNAYLQKHNELMTVYKAYQELFNKVLNYKNELDKYKKIQTTSSITRTQMDKLITDQGFVMDMIDKMQNQLADKEIISNTDKVPVNPVASNPINISTFTDTMREQIKTIIDKQADMDPNMKVKIEDLLSKFKDCDSNDKFCQEGRKILLLRKMS
jgi:hypothetical protein